jgi:hypothetical protein
MIKVYIFLLVGIISSSLSFSQSIFEESQKKIVLEVVDAIIRNDSSKFYSIVDTPHISRHQIVYDFKFLNQRFQHIKSKVAIDSIKHFVEANSIWRWNYKTRVYLLNSKWNYIDLIFMFNSGSSNRIFSFSKEVEFLNEPLKAPGTN